MATTTRSRALLLALLLLLLVAAAAAASAATLSCSRVYSTLMPCLGYVENGGAVPGACCLGIKRLVVAARFTADRRAVCTCLKSLAAAGAKGKPSYVSRAEGLPGRCRVTLHYKFGPNVNCNLIN